MTSVWTVNMLTELAANSYTKFERNERLQKLDVCLSPTTSRRLNDLISLVVVPVTIAPDCFQLTWKYNRLSEHLDTCVYIGICIHHCLEQWTQLRHCLAF